MAIPPPPPPPSPEPERRPDERVEESADAVPAPPEDRAAAADAGFSPPHAGPALPPQPTPAPGPQEPWTYGAHGTPGPYGYPQAGPGPAYPARPAYPTEPGYPGQAGYPTQSGYPPRSGYPTQPAYPTQPGYPGQSGYPAQPAYSQPGGGGFGPGRPPAEGYYPQEAYYAAGWTAPATATPQRRSSGRLFFGLAIGVVVLLVLAGGVAWFMNWSRTRDLGEITEATEATVRQVETGHCIADLPEDGAVTQVTLVPCADPHEAEVVGTHELDDTEWPGQRAVDAEVADWCEMDRTASEAGFRAVAWSPSEAGWADGDRSGVCIAWSPEKVSGSLEDGDVAVP